MFGAAACVLQCSHHLVEIERRRLLARRVLHEVIDLLCHQSLHLVNDEGVVQELHYFPTRRSSDLHYFPRSEERRVGK